MKAVFIVLIISAFPFLIEANESLSVISVLSQDRPIWPLPKPHPDCIVVKTSWKSGRELLKIQSGDWYRVWNLYEYRVEEKHRDKVNTDTISFIVERRYPTPESGIMVKGLPVFFSPGTEAKFYLLPKKKEKPYYIQTYEIWKHHGSPQFHNYPLSK